jgi:predicted nucleotidyltransferase
MNQREQSPADVRTEMLSRSVAQFSLMSGFTGIFLGGSLANQTEDEFSDVDLRVVSEAAFLPAALSDRERFPKQWGRSSSTSLSVPSWPSRTTSSQ